MPPPPARPHTQAQGVPCRSQEETTTASVGRAESGLFTQAGLGGSSLPARRCPALPAPPFAHPPSLHILSARCRHCHGRPIASEGLAALRNSRDALPGESHAALACGYPPLHEPRPHADVTRSARRKGTPTLCGRGGCAPARRTASSKQTCTCCWTNRSSPTPSTVNVIGAGLCVMLRACWMSTSCACACCLRRRGRPQQAHRLSIRCRSPEHQFTYQIKRFEGKKRTEIGRTGAHRQVQPAARRGDHCEAAV